MKFENYKNLTAYIEKFERVNKNFGREIAYLKNSEYCLENFKAKNSNSTFFKFTYNQFLALSHTFPPNTNNTHKKSPKNHSHTHILCQFSQKIYAGKIFVGVLSYFSAY
jgi:hypothetical protein